MRNFKIFPGDSVFCWIPILPGGLHFFLVDAARGRPPTGAISPASSGA